MVKDLGLAVELKLDYRVGNGELVMAGEIERAVRCVMDGKSEIRKRVKEIAKKSREAVMDGESSFASFGELIKIFRDLDISQHIRRHGNEDNCLLTTVFST
ncbi:hypothetical protein CRYUN_Cryun01aG0118700 [Craigia yunnanensis]